MLKGEKEYYEFYHDYISPTLNKIVKEQKNIHTIGLFGNWGSGKSTIIENLKADYSEFPLFLFDVWKYKGDPLRRTFLIKFYNFINTNNLWEKNKKVEESELDSLYESKTTSEIVKRTSPSSKIHVVTRFILYNFILIALGLLLFSWLILQLSLGESHPWIHNLLLIVGYASQSTAFVIIFGWILKKFVEKLIDRIFESINKDINTQTIIKTRDYLNSPEQFEEKFINIVSSLNKKVVVVFDNIDRVQGDVAVEILSAIKTFIEPRDESNVIFIIPCDAIAIEEQIRNYYGNTHDGNEVDPSEYLRKLFNVVIWTPDFIPTDLEDFTRKQIDEIGDSEGLVKGNDDIVRITTQAFKSPREIKQFLNNLIAAIMVASGTDVWDDVKQNLAYLAKVLVLKQKFPKAYKLLKERWYSPEDIVPNTEGDHRALRDFLTSTSTIQVANAEPYIYFKISNTEKQFPASKNLLPALASEDIEASKQIIQDNLANKDALIDFILGLYSKYTNQEDWLTRIVKTFTTSINELNISIEKDNYYNRTAEVIERYVWKSYRTLDINLIFKQFIRNKKVKKDFRDNLIKRYVAALSSKEIIDENGIKTAKAIIENLSLVKNISQDRVLEICNIIETNYIVNPDVVVLLKDIELQKRFVTKNALEKYIQTMNLQNLQSILPTLVPYKALVKEYTSENVLINTLIPIITQERTAQPDHNSAKQRLFELIWELVDTPDSIFENTDTNLLANLQSEMITNYKSIPSIDNKFYLIPIMYNLSKYTNDTHSNIASDSDDRVIDYINNASTNNIEGLITTLGNEGPTFVYEYSSAFAERAVSRGGEDIQKVYEIMGDEEKQEVINALIEGRADFGVPYIQSISKIPNRIETISKLLSQIESHPVANEKREAFNLLSKLIKKNDAIEIKEIAVNQIKSLLMNDDSSSQEMAYTFLNKASFISNTQIDNLAEGALEWLMTPGKIVSHNHRFVLKFVTDSFRNLKSPQQEALLSLVFDMLGRADDRSTNIVALEVVETVKPKWKNNQLHFEGFRNKVDKWGNAADRDFIINEILNRIMPKKPRKKEKEYWDFLSDMINATTD